MTPGEASEQGAVLIIDHPEGGRRVAAHVFDIEGGIAFLDSGWTDPLASSHVVHMVEAEFSEFEMGWGGTRANGEDVFIERYPGSPPQEGDREAARRAFADDFTVSFR